MNSSLISNLIAESGKDYAVNKFEPNEFQYMDRDYKFEYIPQELRGAFHIKTCGNDKLISEHEKCISFDVDRDVDVYILFADKFPCIPEWLKEFTRIRMNVTRQDTRHDTLKGYFSLFKKAFSKGCISLNGCSPEQMLQHEWFVKSGGCNYCMYTVCIIAH